ncbi:MAG: hypothetical protein HEEMFOPI_01400 [Holosporales bacterium]
MESCQASKCYGGNVQIINDHQSVQTFHESTEHNFLTLTNAWNTPTPSSSSKTFTLFSSLFESVKIFSESTGFNGMIIGFCADILFKIGIPLLVFYTAIGYG